MPKARAAEEAMRTKRRPMRLGSRGDVSNVRRGYRGEGYVVVQRLTRGSLILYYACAAKSHAGICLQSG